MRPTTEGHWITQGFSTAHPATDWGMPNGSGLQAVKAGVIRDLPGRMERNRPLVGRFTNAQHWHPSRGGLQDAGNILVIDHEDGTYSAYLHVSPYNVNNVRGRRVRAGERLPVTSGHNGWSTGPHLHFEVFVNGRRINPVPWLDNIKPPTSGGGSNVTKTNRTDLNNIYRDVLGRNRGSGEGEDVYLDKDYRWVHRDIRTSSEAKRYRERLASQVSEIASLKSEVGKLKTDNKQANDSLSKQRKENERLSTQVKNKSGEIEVLQDDVANLKNDKKQLEAEIKQADKEYVKLEKINKKLGDDLAAQKQELEWYDMIRIGIKKGLARLTKGNKND